MQAVGITWKASAAWVGLVRVWYQVLAWVWGALPVGEARGFLRGLVRMRIAAFGKPSTCSSGMMCPWDFSLEQNNHSINGFG